VLPAHAQRVLGGLAADDVVLDVGGWADPFPRADWVLDVMPYDSRGLYEREGWVEPRPAESERFDASTWIQRDVCSREPFPFADGEIDFVICSHTLEDLRDPVWVCREICRVGKAGYVEVPSRLEEQSWGVDGPYVGWAHHHWLVDVVGDGLEFVFKPHDIHVRPDCHFPGGFWDRLSAEERVRALWWEGDFPARERVFVEPSPYAAYLPDFVSAELARRPLARSPVGRSLAARVRRKLSP
jgi:hypothetical protein